MLETFFTSRVRVKILKLFFLSNVERYHVRDITRQIDEEINAVRRELSRLFKIKLLGREKRGNRVYYFMRRNFIFYPEMFRMLIKEFGIGEEFNKKSVDLSKIKFIGVASEWYSDRERSHSEVDLLIIGNLSLKLLSEIVSKYETKTKKEINYTLLSEDEYNSMKQNKTPFLSKFFKQDIIVLLGDREKFFVR